MRPDKPTVPDEPVRSERLTFADRVGAFLTWLATTLIDYIEAAMSYFDGLGMASGNTALASANFKGAWSGLTGALLVPASVSHDGSYWILEENVADVTAEEPGVSDKWGKILGILTEYEEFLTSGTWTKPTNANWVRVELVGAGAGGPNNTSTTAQTAGGGGAYVDKIFRATELGATETVGIGAGGTGKANATSGAGANGGDTTFGTHLTAPGGKGSGLGGDGTRAGQDLNISGLYTGASSYGCGGGSYAYQGGSCVKGGAGGGCAGGSPGGTSLDGGDGGDGNKTASTKAGDGEQPGGGGGASRNDGGGGDGGDGRCRIWVW